MIYVSDNRITELSSKRTLESALKERQERQLSAMLENPDIDESDLTWVLKAWKLDEHGEVEVNSQLFLRSWLEKGKFRIRLLVFNPDWERQYAQQKAGL